MQVCKNSIDSVIVPNEYRGWNVARAVSVAKIKPEFDKNFIRYCFKLDEIKYQLYGNTNDTVQPTLNLSLLKEIDFKIPPLPTQIAIAEVLGSLDDKIDLLHRQNQTLEQLADTLFRQWFVEGAEEGWEEKGLDEIAEFLNGLACQKYPPKQGETGLPVIKIKEMRAGITESSDYATADVQEKYIVQDGDMLFSWSGSLDIVLWFGGTGVLNQHLFKVNSQAFPQWFYYFWTRHHLEDFKNIANDKATTMGHIQRHHLSDARVLIPPKKILAAMDEAIDPFFQKIKTNTAQIRTLTQLRDGLLPQLMGGQVQVPGCAAGLGKRGV
jgi:type I restriction enzyme, S subunit